MKSFPNKLSYIFLILIFLIGFDRLFFFLTDDFSYSNITSTLSYHREWDIAISESDLKETKKALNQSYSYLTSGSQSYVFISEDQQYVLKFFKHKRWRLNCLLKILPLTGNLNAKRERLKQKKIETVYATFESCLTAYKEFKDETGVLFVHLNKTPFDYIITFKDRLRFKHQIKLGDVAFILQRKAVPTDLFLLSLKQEEKIQEAKAALSSLLAFILKRVEKGYSDKDPHLIRNFGFIEGRAVEIDIGGFYYDPKKDCIYFHTHEIKKIQNKLFPWLEKYYPELIPYAKEEFIKLIY